MSPHPPACCYSNVQWKREIVMIVKQASLHKGPGRVSVIDGLASVGAVVQDHFCSYPMASCFWLSLLANSWTDLCARGIQEEQEQGFKPLLEISCSYSAFGQLLLVVSVPAALPKTPQSLVFPKHKRKKSERSLPSESNITSYSRIMS